MQWEEWHKAGVKQLPLEKSLASTQRGKESCHSFCTKEAGGVSPPALLQSLLPWAYRYLRWVQQHQAL